MSITKLLYIFILNGIRENPKGSISHTQTVRTPVQNCIRLGLVLIAWNAMFNDTVADLHIPSQYDSSATIVTSSDAFAPPRFPRSKLIGNG